MVVDEALRGRRNMVTGANEDGFHLRGVDIERDIDARAWMDLREVESGEPCPMCAGAIIQARIPKVVFGASDLKAGACESLYHITADKRLNHQADVLGGILADQCGAVLSTFFHSKRNSREQ